VYSCSAGTSDLGELQPARPSGSCSQHVHQGAGAQHGVAALQEPGRVDGDPSSFDAPSDTDESELSDASSSEESEGDLPPPGDPPDHAPAGGRGAEPSPAHEAAVLMGLGDLVGRCVLRGLESVSWDNESPDEDDQRGERRPPEGGGGGGHPAIMGGSRR